MSKTWYGHHIETIKGEDYVLHKDYTELQNKLDKEIERLNNIINELEDMIVIKLQRDYHEYDYRINTGDLEEIYDRLKELKESGNNE